MTITKDMRNGVWLTPPEIFEPLRKEFNLQIDAAASADNALLPSFWDEHDDAFQQNWNNKRIWCNPPYGRGLYKWVQKMDEARRSVVVALLPVRTDTRWFHDFIYKKSEIRFIKGRIKFSGMLGTGTFASMIVIFDTTASAGSSDFARHPAAPPTKMRS